MEARRKKNFAAFVVLVTSISLIIFTISMKAAAQPKPTAKPIVIGCAVPLGFMVGIISSKSATVGVEEINAAGGVNIGGVKHPLKLEVADVRDTDPGVPTSESLIVIEKLILDKGAKFFVGGPMRSEVALASMDLFSKYKALVIWGSGFLSPAFTQRMAENRDKYKHLFRQSGDVVFAMKEFSFLFEELKAKHGLNKVSVIVQDVAHARGAGDAVAELIKKMGWTITGKERFPQGTQDFSAPLLDAKEKGAQVLFIWGEAPVTQILIKQWYSLKIPALPIGFMSNIEPVEAWAQTDKQCEYVICSQINSGAVYANFNPWVEKWWDAYKKRWGTEPEAFSVQVPYTSLYVLKDAIERTGSLDPDKVAKAIEETDLKGTPQGRIRFDKNHNVIPSLDPEEGAVGSIFQWQAGKRVLVFPSKIAVGKIQLPPWMKK